MNLEFLKIIYDITEQAFRFFMRVGLVFANCNKLIIIYFLQSYEVYVNFIIFKTALKNNAENFHEKAMICMQYESTRKPSSSQMTFMK